MREHHPLYHALCAILGSDYVRDDAQTLAAYAKDVSPHPGVKHGVVVRPGSTKEVSEVMKLANREKCPVVVRGGGNGVQGVTRGIPSQNIVIDTGRMNQVTEIDLINSRVEFGAGIKPVDLDKALAPYGYFAHTVLGPYFADSMGGLIAGVQGGGYPKDLATSGLNWRNILGLTVVLPTGKILHTGAGPDNNIMRDKTYYREAPGPDILGLFIGNGGIYGIITEVTLRIYKKPKIVQPFGFIFNTLDEGWGAMLDLAEDTPCPHSEAFLTTADVARRFGSQIEGDYCLLLSVQSDDQRDVDIRMEKIHEICAKHNGTYGDAGCQLFASMGMTGSAKIVRETSANSCPFTSIESIYPREGALEMLKKMEEQFHAEPDKLAQYGAGRVLYAIPIANFVMMGLTLHWDDNIPGASEYILELQRRGATLINRAGSSITYMQGKATSYIADMWSPTYYNFIKGIKDLLDPNDILQPGLWNL